MLFQGDAKCITAGAVCLSTRHHDKIVMAQQGPVYAKTFPHQSLDQVSVHREWNIFLGYCQSQASTGQIVLACQNGKIPACGFNGVFEDTLKLGGFDQTIISTEARVVHMIVRRVPQLLRRSGVRGPWHGGH